MISPGSVRYDKNWRHICVILPIYNSSVNHYNAVHKIKGNVYANIYVNFYVKIKMIAANVPKLASFHDGVRYYV